MPSVCRGESWPQIHVSCWCWHWHWCFERKVMCGLEGHEGDISREQSHGAPILYRQARPEKDGRVDRNPLAIQHTESNPGGADSTVLLGKACPAELTACLVREAAIPIERYCNARMLASHGPHYSKEQMSLLDRPATAKDPARNTATPTP